MNREGGRIGFPQARRSPGGEDSRRRRVGPGGALADRSARARHASPFQRLVGARPWVAPRRAGRERWVRVVLGVAASSQRQRAGALGVSWNRRADRDHAPPLAGRTRRNVPAADAAEKGPRASGEERPHRADEFGVSG